MPPSARTADRVRALRPPTVVADVARRLSRLSPEAVALARALAVLDGEAELRHVVALADLPAAPGEAAADELTLARLVGSGRPLRFAHPLLRAAVEAELPPARRAASHRRAASILDAEPALADRAAAHLLACEPAADPWVAARLRGAAQRALARGAPEAAVRLLERALREPDEGWEVRFALGCAHRLAGRLEPAAAQLALALAAAPPGPPHAQIAPELATALALSGRSVEGVAVLERERAALPDDAPGRKRLASSELGLRGLVDAVVVDAAQRVEDEAARAGEDADGMLLGALALTRARTGSEGAAGAAAAAHRALAGDRLLREQPPGAAMFVFVAHVLTIADREDETERWLDVLAGEAAERGAEMTLTLVAMGRARVRLFRGELGPAAALAREGLEGALVGSSYLLLPTAGTLTDILVERGELDEADRLLDDLELDGPALPAVGGALTLLRARMRLRSAQGRHPAARADAEDVLARLERRGHRGPGPLGEVAAVLRAAGEDELSRSLAADDLERAHRWGTASALGVARRMFGSFGDRRLREEAVDDLQATPCRLEQAKALLELGDALRRSNQRAAARERLRPALDLAARCQAAPLVERAEAELRATGARPRRALLTGPDALTPSERRVAELVARGLSNPEVARELVVSRTTVESHLRAAYRKLDIASRDELGKILEARGCERAAHPARSQP
jgi:DNA-binding CsgD family transcriptional regulator